MDEIIFMQVYHVLKERMASIRGSLVENNKFCLSVHYRCVDEAVSFITVDVWVFSVDLMMN